MAALDFGTFEVDWGYKIIDGTYAVLSISYNDGLIKRQAEAINRIRESFINEEE